MYVRLCLIRIGRDIWEFGCGFGWGLWFWGLGYCDNIYENFLGIYLGVWNDLY